MGRSHWATFNLGHSNVTMALMEKKEDIRGNISSILHDVCLLYIHSPNNTISNDTCKKVNTNSQISERELQRLNFWAYFQSPALFLENSSITTRKAQWNVIWRPSSVSFAGLLSHLRELVRKIVISRQTTKRWQLSVSAKNSEIQLRSPSSSPVSQSS